jgi:pSer/pThr/pTyr-binding forkhead associated (FHA) protein
MNITCNICGYEQNPKEAEFCDACGAELATEVATISTPPSAPPIPSPVVNIPDPSAPTVIQAPVVNIPPPSQPPSSSSSYPDTVVIPVPQPTPVSIPQPTPVSIPLPVLSVSTANTARLVAKQANAPVPEFSIAGSALIGIFDPDQGPVDIDLENFAGGETISRQHAEIYLEAGIWRVKDLGSTNGVFIKPGGQSRFNARIMAPTALNPGDEIAIAKVCFIFQSP